MLSRFCVSMNAFKWEVYFWHTAMIAESAPGHGDDEKEQLPRQHCAPILATGYRCVCVFVGAQPFPFLYQQFATADHTIHTLCQVRRCRTNLILANNGKIQWKNKTNHETRANTRHNNRMKCDKAVTNRMAWVEWAVCLGGIIVTVTNLIQKNRKEKYNPLTGVASKHARRFSIQILFGLFHCFLFCISLAFVAHFMYDSCARVGSRASLLIKM